MDGDGNTNEVLIDHRNGNTAIARVVVRPSIPATSGPTSDTLLAVLALQAPANDDSSEERDSVFAELGSSQPAELDFFRPT
jgi:hypothetical protein